MLLICICRRHPDCLLLVRPAAQMRAHDPTSAYFTGNARFKQASFVYPELSAHSQAFIASACRPGSGRVDPRRRCRGAVGSS